MVVSTAIESISPGPAFISQIGIMFAGYSAAIIQYLIIQGNISTIIPDYQQGG